MAETPKKIDIEQRETPRQTTPPPSQKQEDKITATKVQKVEESTKQKHSKKNKADSDSEEETKLTLTSTDLSSEKAIQDSKKPKIMSQTPKIIETDELDLSVAVKKTKKKGKSSSK